MPTSHRAPKTTQALRVGRNLVAVRCASAKSACWVLVVLIAAVVTACSAEWAIEHPADTSFGDRSPRLELVVDDMWVGQGERPLRCALAGGVARHSRV